MTYGAPALSDAVNLHSRVSRAVIKEARRRQRRRRITIAAIVLALASGLAIFGARGHRSTTSSDKVAARSRSVTVVYLKDATSPAKVEAILTAMRGRQGVAGVTFVSKSAALSVEKQQVPSLLVGGRNPLPAAIVVRLTAAGSTRGIRAALKASGLLPGVAAIRSSRTGNP